MDIYASVLPGSAGCPSFSVLMNDCGTELEYSGPLGSLPCMILNNDYSPFIQKFPTDSVSDVVKYVRRKFIRLLSEQDTPQFRALTKSVFVHDAKSPCPISQKFFLYTYLFGAVTFSAQLSLLGRLDPEPEIASRTSRMELEELFTKLCGNYASNKCGTETVYHLDSAKDLVKCCLFEMAHHETGITKCSNCGRFFIPLKRSDTIYCSNPSPQSPSMTCAQYGSRRLWYQKMKKDDAMVLCRNIASSMRMLAVRHPDVPEYRADLEKFSVESKRWKSEVKNGVKSREDFLEWLHGRRNRSFR